MPPLRRKLDRKPPRLPHAAALVVALVTAAGCGSGNKPDSSPDASPQALAQDSPPVPLDAEPPVSYPTELYQQGVSGTVVLRLFVTDSGVVVADSTRIEETSGYAAFDSAAVAAAPRLRYAPALRSGRAVAAPFRQPIHFRHPGGTAYP
jgi:TonB family protein